MAQGGAGGRDGQGRRKVIVEEIYERIDDAQEARTEARFAQSFWWAVSSA